MRRDDCPTRPELHIPAAILVGVTCTEWTPPPETPGAVPEREMPEVETRPQCRGCLNDVRDCVCQPCAPEAA